MHRHSFTTQNRLIFFLIGCLCLVVGFSCFLMVFIFSLIDLLFVFFSFFFQYREKEHEVWWDRRAWEELGEEIT